MIGDNIIKASVIYIIVTAVGSSVLALPGITFALFSGILFGPVLGIILCSLSSTLAAVISFLISRFFLKDAVKPIVEKNKYLNKLLFEDGNKKRNMSLTDEFDIVFGSDSSTKNVNEILCQPTISPEEPPRPHKHR